MQKLDLLLVNPSNRSQVYGALSSNLSAVEPPLWTGLLAAFVRQQGFCVEIIDAEALGLTAQDVAQKIIEYNPLLVGIAAIGANPSASSTPKMAAVNKLLNMLKEKSPRLKTFIYGIHPSALPEQTLIEERTDFICRGECFYTVSKLMHKIKNDNVSEEYNIKGLWYRKNGNIVAGGWGELVKDLDILPPAAWDLLPMDKYRAHNWHCFSHIEERSPYAVIYTSLGCPFSCAYCNIHALYNGNPGIRFRSMKNVIAEIGLLVEEYKVKNIKIIDELFILKEDRALEFCDLIINAGYDLNIWAYARVDTINEKILKKAKQAGINWLAYGIESANDKVRGNVDKDRFNLAAIKRAINMTHDAGIYVCANFIFGLPQDNINTMQETLNLAKELNCEYTNFYTAMAYPGSELYEEAIKNKVELPRAWSGYAQFSADCCPLPTKYLSAAEVLEFRDNAFYEYHCSPRYLKMMQDKFGRKVVEHIKEILKYKLPRNLLVTKKEKI
jgi:radical SAM superfamily enzyme YgiQ (UPF0313 family)